MKVNIYIHRDDAAMGKLDPKTGQPVKGQGKKRHRPAENKEGDKSFWDRF